MPYINSKVYQNVVDQMNEIELASVERDLNLLFKKVRELDAEITNCLTMLEDLSDRVRAALDQRDTIQAKLMEVLYDAQ